jgi:hypothetical protein
VNDALLPRTNDAACPPATDSATPPAVAPESLPLFERYRTRPNAAAYVSERLGRTVTTGALHRHASDGTGPKYVMILGRASYRTDWLDAWIDSLVQLPAERRRRRASSAAERTTPAAEPGSRSRRAAQQRQSSTSTCDPGPAAREDIEPGVGSPARRTRQTRRSTSTHAA